MVNKRANKTNSPVTSKGKVTKRRIRGEVRRVKVRKIKGKERMEILDKRRS